MTPKVRNWMKIIHPSIAYANHVRLAPHWVRTQTRVSWLTFDHGRDKYVRSRRLKESARTLGHTVQQKNDTVFYRLVMLPHTAVQCVVV